LTDYHRIGIVAAASVWLAAAVVVGARGARSASPQTTPPQTAPPPAATPAAPSGAQSVLDGVFTDAQAKRGQDVFAANCAHCHGDALQGGQEAPPLGPAFIASWKGSTVGDLIAKIRRSMPDDAPASLTDQQYTDVFTFILTSSRYPAGKTELPIDAEKQKLIKIEAIKAGLAFQPLSSAEDRMSLIHVPFTFLVLASHAVRGR
jgi:mono/diheme cytochrome c family protein